MPDDRPLFVRVSATDWLSDRESWSLEDTARLAGDLRELGVDLVDVSAGGIHPDQQIPETGPHYLTPFAEQVRTDAGVPVGAVGKITTPQGADEVVRNGRADLAIVGREHLRDLYFALHVAEEPGAEPPMARQYSRAF
jgi:2,4-dienoyl-CoA reductase-like NADH-dependent reductase (Old Yellow Enzyme family)